MEDEGDDMPTAPFWMTTFSDMVTLLLTFFVMIVAMSEVEVKKFEEALSYFTGRSALLMQEAVVPPAQRQPVTHFQTIEQSQRYEALLDYLKKNGLEDKVEVDLVERGLHVTITDSVMFASGRAELIEPSRTVLRMVAGVLEGHAASVVVEGHTDDRPIHTEQFPSNWELSSARAASVVRFFLQQDNALAPTAYLTVGHGEYHPIDTNRTPEGRARNRRVEILFSWEPWQQETTTRPNLNPLREPVQGVHLPEAPGGSPSSSSR